MLSLTGNNTFTGPVTVEAGTLLRNGTGSGALAILGGLFDLNAGNRTAPSVTLDGGSIINSTGTSAQYLNASTLYDLRSGTVSARLAGTAALVKSGAGTVFLTGANTFTGGTTIQAGELDLAAPGTLSGSVTVAGGTYLVHSSTTTNTGVTVRSGGTFRNWGANVGDVLVQSGGALRNRGYIQGSVTLESGATADAIGSISGDLINAGIITLVGDAPFAVASAITNTGTIDASLWLGTLPAGIVGSGTVIQPKALTLSLDAPAGGVAALSGAANQVQLTVTPDGIAPLGVAWSTVSGPDGATAVFSAADASATTATFSTPGLYVLRATASDARPGRTATKDVSVIHNPFQSSSLRAVNGGYSHTATFLRADNPSWNSGSRDQVLVGKTTSPLRTVFSFDLGGLPNRSAFAAVSLDLWTAAVGSGSVGALELYGLASTPTEGNGNGVDPANGSGSGATWTARAPFLNWITPGGDLAGQALSSIPGFSTGTANDVGVQKTFASQVEFADRLQAASDAGEPLNLLVQSPATESVATPANNFVRFASDDHPDANLRPRLNLTFTPGVPAPWTDGGIGIGAGDWVGDASGLGTPVTYVVSGGGANIGGSNDAFHYAHRTTDADGNCEIVARIAAVHQTTGNSKVGVMIRASSDANASNVFLGLTADGWLNFHVRNVVGGSTTHVTGSPKASLRPPLWVKLVRSGDTYSAFYSSDGANWNGGGISPATVTGIPAQALVGLAVTSRVVGAPATAAFTGVTVTP
ncbi:MAG: autotransporter-associated beta strand repeat-containing protein [Opitutaceae bacterium]|nr:autotransporter-associated beta strand repeat-containing protein [Opitutaceae bacterium]